MSAAVERELESCRIPDQTADAVNWPRSPLYEELGHAARTLKAEDSRFYAADPARLRGTLRATLKTGEILLGFAAKN